MNKSALPFTWLNDIVDADDVVRLDNDLILFDHTAIRSVPDYPFKPEYVVGIVCTGGDMRMSVNLKPYHAIAPCVLVSHTFQTLQFNSFSDDFQGFFSIMAPRFAGDLFQNSQDTLPVYLSVYENSLIPITRAASASMRTIYSLILQALKTTDNPFRAKVVKHLINAAFYGAGYHFHQIEIKTKNKKEALVDDFLNLLRTNFREHRDTAFYADKMCLTVKYLSKVLKENSRKSASDWIEEFVMNEAKALLKSTKMTVQQISDELNFPSQSFFGKYFKRQTGVSPKEYRK
ncbi:MAG: helix-turn-helix domain-containing protein [Tannerella sp.]|jgi:AraC-like DNA-binding protein|nr:helix-turn-helix domain-containing protein [Tannerella sp.]